MKVHKLNVKGWFLGTTWKKWILENFFLCCFVDMKKICNFCINDFLISLTVWQLFGKNKKNSDFQGMISPSQNRDQHERKIFLCYIWPTLLTHRVSDFSEFPGSLVFLVSDFDRGIIVWCHLCGKAVREISAILQKPKSLWMMWLWSGNVEAVKL